MLALDLRRVPLARARHVGGQMPCICPPMIRRKAGETEGFEQRFALQKDLIFATTKDIGQDRSSAVIDSMPQPPLVLLLADNAPHFVHLGFASAQHIHRHLVRVQRVQQRRVDRLQRGFFLPELIAYCAEADVQHPRGIAHATGMEAPINDLVLDRGQTPAVALVEEKTPLSTCDILAPGAWFATARCAAFDDWLAVTVGTSDRDERHGPLLASGSSQDRAQCDINLSRSPLLEHYPIVLGIKSAIEVEIGSCEN